MEDQHESGLGASHQDLKDTEALKVANKKPLAMLKEKCAQNRR